MVKIETIEQIEKLNFDSEIVEVNGLKIKIYYDFKVGAEGWCKRFSNWKDAKEELIRELKMGYLGRDIILSVTKDACVVDNDYEIYKFENEKDYKMPEKTISKNGFMF